ncbi:MAG: cytochrome c oxidase accessory protein CcoG [Planctomycetes bacterium]|nr:cytochrome c oxidase accessory protein CcoG [Planctomycetota bacterium]
MTAKIQRGMRRKPDLETVYSINADGSRNMLQPADVRGRWHKRRNWIFLALIAFYVIVPWLRMDGAPLLRFDVPNRTAYIVGHTFTRDDFFLVFFLLTGFGFALFAVTSLLGRVWCGYACPQTVFLEGVYRRIEIGVEGDHHPRAKRNKGPWNFDKLWRKSLKQLLFLALTLAITHTLLAYFLPVEELLPALLAGPSTHWVAFAWTMALSAVIYFDFAWFREQFCVILCPYGRLQSALIDDDSVVIGYDEKRGEPRGPKGRAEGACIDCGSCVNVCPTGIDIRNGLQLECIGCTNCVDACDSIMRQIGRPEGLIRYDSLRGFQGGKHRWLRPRVFLYVGLALLGLTVFLFTASGRSSFEAAPLRARGMPYTLEDQRIQNLYSIHVQNKGVEPRRFALEAYIADGAQAPAVDWRLGATEVELESLGEATVSVFASVDRALYRAPFPVGVRVRDVATGETVVVDLNFQGP